ncbi:DnaJ domain-containing protein [Niveomyces insectorum RCEF 264]|uniref:DnaJ domain-containing protein n=1 Tax=Niveomyces insectorum RCEF 264 TaxID=1081102 RepID=A0A167RU12_9HYPO|nr:DnaJ domain-containing protein [Niveomyces insectorum RCEF 264]
MLTHLYLQVLGLNRDAGDREIKSAYRQLSKKFHPDKNPYGSSPSSPPSRHVVFTLVLPTDLRIPCRGDTSAKDKFVEVSEAYEALSDPQTRKIYDQYGHEGLKKHQQQGGGGQHHDPFDIFSRFFGGSGHFGQPTERRGPNVELKVALSLRDFYNGRTSDFQWDKQEICDHCDGTGAEDKVVETCPKCNGHGILVTKHQLAPGMFQQVQMHCDMCGGRGKSIKHVCHVCQGQRVLRRPTPVTVTVARGAAKGSQIVYENEADASPDYVAGDLIVTLMEKEPGDPNDNPDRVDGVFFRRKGNDLFWKELISLREAWMGDWTRNLTHLDGHVVELRRARGHIIQPGHVDTIVGEGMPIWHEDGDSVYHRTEFGNLYVEYAVVLPDQMESEMEQEFWGVWEKWRGKIGVDLHKDSGRPDRTAQAQHHDRDEL